MSSLIHSLGDEKGNNWENTVLKRNFLDLNLFLVFVTL